MRARVFCKCASDLPRFGSSSTFLICTIAASVSAGRRFIAGSSSIADSRWLVVRGGDELRDRGLGAWYVQIVRLPWNGKLGIAFGIDVVDFEVIRAGDPLRRETHAQAALDFRARGRRSGDIAAGASSDQARQNRRLDHHITQS